MEQTVVIAGSGIMGASLAQVYAGGGWKTSSGAVHRLRPTAAAS